MKTIDTLVDMDWFANVGKAIPVSAERLISVADWHQAVASCAEPLWEDVCTEARNDLTIHLNRVCKAEFQSWNEVVNNAKRELAESWKRMRLKLESEGLPEIVAGCVEWDTMHAVACEHYSAWSPPQFFARLLVIYQSGHFPCGWVGTWPEGNLRVF